MIVVSLCLSVSYVEELTLCIESLVLCVVRACAVEEGYIRLHSALEG